MLYDQVSSAEPPVSCQLEASMLEKLVMIIPMRCTNKALKEVGENQVKGGVVNTQVMTLLQNVCMQLVGNRRPGIDVADCPLEILTPQIQRQQAFTRT